MTSQPIVRWVVLNCKIGLCKICVLVFYLELDFELNWPLTMLICIALIWIVCFMLLKLCCIAFCTFYYTFIMAIIDKKWNSTKRDSFVIFYFITRSSVMLFIATFVLMRYAIHYILPEIYLIFLHLNEKRHGCFIFSFVINIYRRTYMLQ